MVTVFAIQKFKMAFSNLLLCEARRDIHATCEVILLICGHIWGWNARGRRGRRSVVTPVVISGTMAARHFCMYG